MKLSFSRSSWKDVKNFIIKNVTDVKKAKDVEKSLHDLWRLTKELTGDEESSLIDDLAIFLIRLFLKQTHVLTKHIAQMKNFFGEVTSKQSHQILQHVSVISSNLNEDSMEKLQKLVSEDSTEDKKKLFGSSIKILSFTEFSHDTEFLQDLQPRSLVPSSEIIDAFSMKYEEKVPVQETTGTKYDRTWLNKHIDPDIVDPLITTIKSKKSNDELQNELFELMGELSM